MSELKAGVGLSRKWDAREAGREVAETALEKLEGEKPKFFLLFSTIHYEKYGGFQELLNGVWEVLPEGTPLIGGTVAGFMNNYGCFARGATALTVAYPNMDVAVGVGHNTKKSPVKAAGECAKMIKANLRDRWQNRFLVSLVSGPEILELPSGERKKVIRGITARFAKSFWNLSRKTFQKGAAMDDEILEELAKAFPDHSILSGCLTDDLNLLRNYQFINGKVYTNAIVSLAVTTDLPFCIHSTHGAREIGIKCTATKLSGDKRIIEELDGEPAVNRFLKLLNWPICFLDEETFYKIFLYYPIGFRKEEQLVPRVVGSIIGEALVLSSAIESNELSLLTISGKEIVETVVESLKVSPKEMQLMLASSCFTRLETLGKEMYAIKDIIASEMKERPFLVFYVAGEGLFDSITKKRFNLAMSFNTIVIGGNKNERDR